jgi:UDP-glucuronate decarboxylase
MVLVELDDWRDPVNRPRTLVTGGTGFLGSHRCDRLLERAEDVLCADNCCTGTRDNITHLLDHPRCELLRNDVTFPLYVEVEQIYNVACPASPIHYQRDPVQTTKTSVRGAINMLGPAKRTKAKILQASTSEVYGDAQIQPQTEGFWGNVNPIGPAAATTKVAAPPRPSSSTISASTACASRWRASSTPTAGACTPTTAAG